MSSNAAKNVNLLRVLVSAQSVNVGAAYGVLWGPLDLRFFTALAIEVENPDAIQTLDVLVDIATNINGPWSTSLWNGLQGIDPLANRSDVFNKAGQLFLRLVAKASGGGVNNVIFSVSGLEQLTLSGVL